MGCRGLKIKEEKECPDSFRKNSTSKGPYAGGQGTASALKGALPGAGQYGKGWQERRNFRRLASVRPWMACKLC